MARGKPLTVSLLEEIKLDGLQGLRNSEILRSYHSYFEKSLEFTVKAG